MPHSASENGTASFDLRYLRHAFDKRASRFSMVDFLMREVAQRMQAHLAFIKIKPTRILDMGCATGQELSALHRLYPQAEIIGLDWSFKMLAQVTANASVGKRLRDFFLGPRFPLIQADWCQLPLPAQSVDFIWSNLALHWAALPHLALKEWTLPLRTNGLLMFSALGPDSLKELRSAFTYADDQPHTLAFTDMHDLGDMLVNNGLADPVVDAEYLTVTYETPEKLLDDIRRAGIYPFSKRLGLKGKQWYQRLREALESQRRNDNLIPLSFELVYGHAWKPARLTSTANEEGVAHIGLDQITYPARR